MQKRYPDFVYHTAETRVIGSGKIKQPTDRLGPITVGAGYRWRRIRTMVSSCYLVCRRRSTAGNDVCRCEARMLYRSCSCFSTLLPAESSYFPTDHSTAASTYSLIQQYCKLSLASHYYLLVWLLNHLQSIILFLFTH